MSTGGDDSAVIFLGDPPRTPPFSATARRRVGRLIRLLQLGESLGMPASRPMPSIGPRCHELRVRDAAAYWRVVYRLDPGVVVIVHSFPKMTEKTPKGVIRLCRERLGDHDAR